MRSTLPRPLSLLLSAAALTMCTASLRPARVRAGNDDGILVGGQAALTAGAVTATVSDGSAAWYNPAGIARIQQQTLDINASVYGISMQSAKHFITLADGTQQNAKATDWQLIPSALSYARHLSKRVVGAFSIIIPKTTDFDLRTSAAQGDGTRWTFGADEVRNEYDYIVSFGWRISDSLRLGFALHGIYISAEEFFQIGMGQQDAPGAPFASFSGHTMVGDYGLRLGFGVQWSLSPELEVGLAIQSPTLTGFRKTVETAINGSLSPTMEPSFASYDRHHFEGVWEFSTPLAVRLGMAYQFSKVQVMVDGSLYSPLDSSERTLDRKLSANGRVGCLAVLSDKLAFGLGAFTDFARQREPDLDYAGVAGGVRLTTKHRMVDAGRTLSFVTTLAGRYAYGWGFTQGVSFEENRTSGTDFTLNKIRASAHELAFNLGGGVSF